MAVAGCRGTTVCSRVRARAVPLLLVARQGVACVPYCLLIKQLGLDRRQVAAAVRLFEVNGIWAVT